MGILMVTQSNEVKIVGVGKGCYAFKNPLQKGFLEGKTN